MALLLVIVPHSAAEQKGAVHVFPWEVPCCVPPVPAAAGISEGAGCQVKALSPAGCVSPSVVCQASSAEGRAGQKPWSRDRCCPGAPPSPTRTFWMS